MNPIASEHGHFLKNQNKPKSYDRSAVGLCFSGGGYRATLFHAGAILRLNEFGLVHRATRIASVSGGSITTGVLAMVWDKLEFDSHGIAPAETMQEHFLRPILQATSVNVDVKVGFKGLLPGFSAGNALADAYDRNIFGSMRIRDVPETPRFIWCATNLQTGGLFRFERHALRDWRALNSTTKEIRLSQAVAASSAFPPFLSPLRLDLKAEDTTVPDYARFRDPALLRRPVLVDGGVYDNLGLEPIWKNCGVIYSSCAGSNSAARPSSLTLDHMVPVLYTFLDSSIDWRERVLVYLYRNTLQDNLPERAGAYWTMATDPQRFTAWNSGWKAGADILAAARAQPTRLRRFSRAEQMAAILSGYSYADASIRSYALIDAPPPAGPPVIPTL